MKHGYVINVMSEDRPGIVAGVSTTISDLGGNIESCSQTVLNGYFTLIMMFTLKEEWNVEELKENILQTESLYDCQIMISAMPPSAEKQEENKPDIYVITAFGKDRKSIVAAFSQYLSGKEINILDLYGNITSNNEFVLISQVEIDSHHDIKNIQLDLEELGNELDFTVRLQHNNIFVATNQIRLDT